MNKNTGMGAKAEFRQYKEIQEQINKALLAYPERFTNESHFYRVAVIKLLRELQEEARNNTYGEVAACHRSSLVNSSHSIAAPPRSQSFIQHTSNGLEVQENKQHGRRK